MSDNLELWRSVEKTDPKFTTKARAGGHNFTSANAQWQIMRATEMWGSCGYGWEVKHRGQIIEASAVEKIWVEEVTIKYPGPNGEMAEVSQYGVAKLCYQTTGDSGYFKVDEQAPKKAYTNGISKALSLLGFSADLWLKYYDNPEYVEAAGRSFEAERESQKEENIRKRLIKVLEQTGADPDTPEEDLLCRFWSDGKYDKIDAFESVDVAREIVKAQSEMCSTIPVAKQLDKAREYSKGGA